ncbi:MAG: Acetyl-CoA:oxalate CoA-transferase [Alphaproteobacteria bacterium MarineAlpha3_Bin5]|nr:CoA transferase [Magnetovibrio sp.]PPR76981.1 MAG: Acetyl-CoA:oxalate CoA-transferase [Alphaproteobacteria bacterium MarineAlpha3_Bin5]
MSEREKDSFPDLLAGIRVLDLTRILAGPTATQLLGDLGADVIKVERPGYGDDTRTWGPPFVKDSKNMDTSESAYYLSANRNKRSVAIDFSQPKGKELLKQLLASSDVLIHNFKVGGLEKYKLGYNDLKDDFPTLVYCAITGYGQTGPHAERAGYDFLAQAAGGLMSVTGEEGGQPIKVGVAIADIVCGMYAATAILAAVRYRDSTGTGQMIDLGLLDTQIAFLANQGINYLLSKTPPQRLGNAHPNVVPYQVFQASDGFFVLAIGNDQQFFKFCKFANALELVADRRFRNNSDRVSNRDLLIKKINELTCLRTVDEWVKGLAGQGVPVGPINNIEEALNDEQVKHRKGVIDMPYPLAKSGKVELLANPIKFSLSPVSYRYAPPRLGEHTKEVLVEILGIKEEELEHLASEKII